MHIVSKMVLIISLFFLAFTFSESITQGEFKWGIEVLPIIVIGGLVYYLTLQMIILAWYYLIKNGGETKATFNTCYNIYAKSQIAKYLPGNIFHYAGRHVMGRRLDWGNSVLISSVFIETGGLMVASVSVVLIGLIINLNLFDIGSNFYQKIYLSIFIGFIILFLPYFSIQLINKIEWKQKQLKDIKIFFLTNKIKWLSYIGIPLILYLQFFIFNGLVLYMITIYKYMNFSNLAEIGYFIGCLSLSWLIGFVTPGAPGGLGIRETVMTTILSQILSNSQALEVAFLFRAITIMGDGILYLSTFVIKQAISLELDKH